MAFRSIKWYMVRRHFIKLKENSYCYACGTDKKLEVHHIVPYQVDESLELVESNMITLCKRCHLVFGHFGDFRKYNEAVVEDCIAYKMSRINHTRQI
jgi:hypothetical protein